VPKFKKTRVSLYKGSGVAATLLAALALGSVGCADPARDGTTIAYAMSQRSLPGCLAAYPPANLDASRCQLAGPVLEYLAVGCDNGSYLLAVEGGREAYSQDRFIAFVSDVVDGQASIDFIDGASGTCDFRTGELTIGD
jgi:hypothetical protein